MTHEVRDLCVADFGRMTLDCGESALPGNWSPPWTYRMLGRSVLTQYSTSSVIREMMDGGWWKCNRSVQVLRLIEPIENHGSSFAAMS